MEILIVDDEIQVREMLSFYLQDNYEPITKIFTAKSRLEASDILSNHLIDFCFCGHSLSDGIGSDVLSFIKKRNLETRFLLMSEQSLEDISTFYNSSDLFFFFSKKDLLSSFDQFLSKCAEDSVILKKKIFSTMYSPVTLEFLQVLNHLPSDVFIKLSSTKFVKCFSSGDLFTESDKIKYRGKNLDILFLKCDEGNKVLINKAISNAINKVFNAQTTPLQERITMVHSQVSNMVKLNGMTPEMAEVTKYTVSKSVDMISKIDILNNFWKKLNLLGDYPSKLYTLQTMLISMILKELEWNSEATFFKLALASFLQDVTLINLKLIKIKDYNEFLASKESLSNEEIKSFLDHPMKVKDIVDKLKEVPPDIDKIVLEQHELPNGDGFPRKLNALQLGQMSCIFILTGITARAILEDETHFDNNVFLDFMDKSGYSKGNFRDSFKILKKILA